MNLLDKSRHIELLDRYIGKDIENFKKQYNQLLSTRKEILKKQGELSADPVERNRKIDLLQYEIDEIVNANLQIGEEEKLIEQKNLFQNSEKISLALNETYSVLNDNIVQGLQKCCADMQAISKFDSEYERIYKVIQEAYYDIEETKRDIGSNLDNIYYDTEEQQKVFDRLDYIFNLKRKYGNTIEDVLDYCKKLQQQLEELNSSNEIIEQLNKEYEQNTYSLFDISLKMHNIRVAKAKEIEKIVNQELIDLEMPKAKFDVVVSFNNNVFEYDKLQNYEFNQNGLDDVSFMICTNVGSRAQLIGKIASGGELSRITLALKVVFANFYDIPTIIFDEIDTGLSGQACVALANKFKNISKKHQIILITHHANIAAIGTNNIFVKKQINEGVTKSFAKVLNEEEKIQEVARILSGNEKTEISLKHAEQLVKNI